MAVIVNPGLDRSGPGEVGSGDQDLYTDDVGFGVDSDDDVFIDELRSFPTMKNPRSQRRSPSTASAHREVIHTELFHNTPEITPENTPVFTPELQNNDMSVNRVWTLNTAGPSTVPTVPKTAPPTTSPVTTPWKGVEPRVYDVSCDETVCPPNSFCSNDYDSGGSRCHCNLGLHGNHCSEGVSIRFPKFYGFSHLALEPLKNSYQSFHISLEFKVDSEDGLLLYCGENEHGRGDFMSLALVRRKLHYRSLPLQITSLPVTHLHLHLHPNTSTNTPTPPPPTPQHLHQHPNTSTNTSSTNTPTPPPPTPPATPPPIPQHLHQHLNTSNTSTNTSSTNTSTPPPPTPQHLHQHLQHLNNSTNTSSTNTPTPPPTPPPPTPQHLHQHHLHQHLNTSNTSTPPPTPPPPTPQHLQHPNTSNTSTTPPTPPPPTPQHLHQHLLHQHPNTNTSSTNTSTPPTPQHLHQHLLHQHLNTSSNNTSTPPPPTPQHLLHQHLNTSTNTSTPPTPPPTPPPPTPQHLLHQHPNTSTNTSNTSTNTTSTNTSSTNTPTPPPTPQHLHQHHLHQHLNTSNTSTPPPTPQHLQHPNNSNTSTTPPTPPPPTPQHLHQHLLHQHPNTNTSSTNTSTPPTPQHLHQHLLHQHLNTSSTNTPTPPPPTPQHLHQHHLHQHLHQHLNTSSTNTSTPPPPQHLHLHLHQHPNTCYYICVFRFNCGTGAGQIISDSSVLVGQWHTVTLFRDGVNGWLRLDNDTPVSGYSLGHYTKITFRTPLFVGGAPSVYWLVKAVGTNQGFQGCVQSLSINGRHTDLRPWPQGHALSGADIGECSTSVCDEVVCENSGVCFATHADNYTCLCPLGYRGVHCEESFVLSLPRFSERVQSYASAPWPQQPRSYLSFMEFHITFKPTSQDGTLLYSHDQYSRDFLSILLVGGSVEFHFDCGSGAAILRSEQPVSLNMWHDLRVSRTAKSGILQVDNQRPVEGSAEGAFTQIKCSSPLYIGGVPDYDSTKSSAGVIRPFSGDIQRITLNDREVAVVTGNVVGVNVMNTPPPVCGEPVC
ncbi:hypothetical protein QTP86_012738 [Hemibagrus guttatus]|nr:hypothetical protein QTP86_012738 [Hemibagrus guttatus]